MIKNCLNKESNRN